MKIIKGFCIGIILSAGLALSVFGSEVTKVTVDGTDIDFDIEPDIVNGTTFVPIRSVIEAYTDEDVGYISGNSGRIMTAYTYDGRFSLDVDKGNYLFVPYFDENAEIGILENKPYIKDGRTMLPVREIIELLGGTVDYDNETKTISLLSEQYQMYSYDEGLPYPVVLRDTDYNIKLASKLTDSEGYEYYTGLLEKLIDYDEDKAFDEEFDKILREFCYNEIKYLIRDYDPDYDDYSLIYSYVGGQYSDWFEKDDSLSDEQSLRNFYDALFKGSEGKIKANGSVLPYAEYAATYIAFYGFYTAEDGIDDFEDIEKQEVWEVWPFSDETDDFYFDDADHIEKYLERYYKDDTEAVLIMKELKEEYAPSDESDKSENSEAQKIPEEMEELFKYYFGDMWYSYLYGENTYNTAFFE